MERWQLVRIEHERCGDYDGTEYVLAPPDWTSEQINEAVRKVQEEMVADAKMEKSPESGYPGFSPCYEDYPHLTVAEVLAQHATKQEEHRIWQEANQHLKRSFETRLSEVGFVRIWDKEADVVRVKTYWGHKHGLSLNYKYSDV